MLLSLQASFTTAVNSGCHERLLNMHEDEPQNSSRSKWLTAMAVLSKKDCAHAAAHAFPSGTVLQLATTEGYILDPVAYWISHSEANDQHCL